MTTISLRQIAGTVVVSAIVAVLSVMFMVTVHRHELGVGPYELPTGMIMAVTFQIAASIFVWATSGTRSSMIVLASVWGIAMLPFAGRGRGGGVLMPAVVEDQPQYSGVLLQLLGVAIPFIVLFFVSRYETRRRRGQDEQAEITGAAGSARLAAPASRSTPPAVGDARAAEVPSSRQR